MDSTQYQFNVTAGDSAHTVYIAGEIDLAASLEIQPQLQKLIENCSNELVLDLDDVTYMDSEGVKTLLATFKWMNDRQRHATIARCSPCVMRILKLTGTYAFLMPCSHNYSA